MFWGLIGFRESTTRVAAINHRVGSAEGLPLWRFFQMCLFFPICRVLLGFPIWHCYHFVFVAPPFCGVT